MEIHKVITNNRIIKIRLADVAILNKKMVETYGLTGVIMRGSNIKKDLRLFGYSIYSIIQFAINQGSKGDCLDRQLIRINECLQSIKIIQQVFNQLKCYLFKAGDSYYLNYFHCYYVMESMIKLFKFIFIILYGFTQVRQEAPKGELGLYIVTDNRNKIYRMKIRSPDYQNFQSLNMICHKHLLADIISILGTTDFVLGSVDKAIHQIY